MARPYGLLRAGFPYYKTLGMRRITNFPIDVAFGKDNTVYILLRSEGASLIRVWSLDDAEQLSRQDLPKAAPHRPATTPESARFK